MSNDTKLYIGTSGWSYDHWVGCFYPEEIKKNEWFPFYTEHFKTVELNMSFYRYPFKNMLAGWKKKMPEDFLMTFKVNRRITHYKKFRDVEDDVEKFYGITENLGDNTGCLLFQTPPDFHYTEDNFKTFSDFLELLKPSHRNVIEFRDAAWWDDEVANLLKKHNVGFCTVSGLDMPCDVITTADHAYFRFHGPGKAYASKYSDKQLEEWAEHITAEIEKNKLQEVFCYFNNDNSGYAVENAKKLIELLSS